MVSTLTRTYDDHVAAMAVVDTFTSFGIAALLGGDPDAEPPVWTVTIRAVRAPDDDPQPHEDDFQESRQWDDFGAAGLGYRRRPSLNDPD